jgi:hypothetical protein
MAISFDAFMDHVFGALGDPTATTWSRTDQILPWSFEAFTAFPILRPRYLDKTAPANVYKYRLPVDFREIISVEYPITKQPPEYLTRKNRFDPAFWSSSNYFDIDNDYTTGDLYTIYFSGVFTNATHMYLEYLGLHDTDLTDDGAHFISIPDEYETIVITSVMCRAYRERLGKYMQNPTAQSSIIMQMTAMVEHLEAYYKQQLADALASLAESRVSPRLASDKYDRVY